MQTKTENQLIMPKRKVYEEKMKAWQVAPSLNLQTNRESNMKQD